MDAPDFTTCQPISVAPPQDNARSRLLVSSAVGHVELIRRHRRTGPALDAKFVPAAPAGELATWTSYVAWAAPTTQSDTAWHIWVSPDFIAPGQLHQLPALQTCDERAARGWLTLLAHAWLRLVENHITTADPPPSPRPSAAR